MNELHDVLEPSVKSEQQQHDVKEKSFSERFKNIRCEIQGNLRIYLRGFDRFRTNCEVSTRVSLSLSPFSSCAMLKTRGAIGAAGDVNIG